MIELKYIGFDKLVRAIFTRVSSYYGFRFFHQVRKNNESKILTHYCTTKQEIPQHVIGGKENSYSIAI